MNKHQWIENFNERVQTIQMEFDAFFRKKQLKELYTIEEAEGSSLSLHICERSEIPSEIVLALSEAFILSNPSLKPK